jgi:hypothetical protein
MAPIRQQLFERNPDPAELYAQLGLNVTICLVASSLADNCLVAVSDRRLSYNDDVEAPDNAALKSYGLTRSWGLLFSERH